MSSTSTRPKAQPGVNQALVPVMAAGDVIATWDRMDEDQILKEMRGDVLSTFVYEFKMAEGNTVRGLSYVGVKEAARYLGGITTELVTPLQVIKDDNGEKWMCVVRATDAQRALSLLGTASQPTKMKLRNGQLKADDFAPQKALSKAQRNAIRALLSEELAMQVIAAFTKQGKVRRVEPSDAAQEPNGNGAVVNGEAAGDGGGIDTDHLAFLNTQLPEAVRWSPPVMKAKVDHDAAGAWEAMHQLHIKHHAGCTCYGASA